MSETVELVRRSLAEGTRETFARRVEAGAAFLREQLATGRLDNADATIGLELECYVVDPDDRLARLPEGCLDDTPVNRELGRHNVEINTPPVVLSETGIEAQATSVDEDLATGRRVAEPYERRIVLDAMWTIPPAEGTIAYLTDREEVDGVVLATNMYGATRYHALDNDVLQRADGAIELDLPGVTETFPSILVESLATSMQPHLQVPDVESFPDYYNAAIRTLGPVLALSTNSPFLPVDLYGDVDARELLDETYHELRIPVFEQSINAGQERGKVRFPRDIAEPADVVDRVVGDETLVPFLQEWVEGEGGEGGEAVEGWAEAADGSPGAVDGGEGGDGTGSPARNGPSTNADAPTADPSFTASFWEFDHKHGTYWRWLRGVLGGDHVDERNDERSLRIEYRPLPTQPTVADVIGLQCLVVGLLRGLVATDHPLTDLDWTLARESFYGVVEDGLDAELHWVTADGERTTDPSDVYDELFDLARRGLADAGVPPAGRDRFLRPIERRWETNRTPSDWKLERVAAAIDAGSSLQEGIESMQRAYIDRSAAGDPFWSWPDAR